MRSQCFVTCEVDGREASLSKQLALVRIGNGEIAQPLSDFFAGSPVAVLVIPEVKSVCAFNDGTGFACDTGCGVV